MKHKTPFSMAGFLILLIAITVSGCRSSAAPTVLPQSPTARPLATVQKPAQPFILFRSDREGAMNWYTMNLDGSGVKPFTFPMLPPGYTFLGAAYEPALGGFFLTLTDQQSWPDLYFTDFQGNIISRITNDMTDEGNPSYDPQGRRVVYVCGMANLDICFANLDGTSPANLTESANNDLDPLWLPDGKILFITTKTGVPALWKMNADGSDLKVLGNFNEAENTPNLSPDGKTVYVAREHERNWEIFSVDTGSGKGENLTGNPAGDFEPRLSPDGNYIVFRSNRDGAGDLYCMKADGSALVRLTSSPDAMENSYGWLPDSSRIIFTETVNGQDDIFSVKTDGSDLLNLTSSPANDVSAIAIGD